MYSPHGPFCCTLLCNISNYHSSCDNNSSLLWQETVPIGRGKDHRLPIICRPSIESYLPKQSVRPLSGVYLRIYLSEIVRRDTAGESCNKRFRYGGERTYLGRRIETTDRYRQSRALGTTERVALRDDVHINAVPSQKILSHYISRVSMT